MWSLSAVVLASYMDDWHPEKKKQTRWAGGGNKMRVGPAVWVSGTGMHWVSGLAPIQG